ncbi:hemerythrin domain-containing protein [Geodermatophilus arenarius]|uniref:Hemerythrin domain-containing protein n=1 Tax=Geodermatophilus arenarius TaxID=1137990 RepID=A0ABV9LND9_9ACTN
MTNTASTAPGRTAVPMADVRDMYVVHRAFRREFGLLPGLVRAVEPGDTARAAVLARHARMVLLGLHLHHTAEDDLLWPRLLERCPPDAAVVHRMEAQHSEVERLIGALGPALDRWEVEARPAVAEEVASTVEALGAVLAGHLAEEEREILPLAQRHVTQAEWAQLGEHGKGEMSVRDLPLLFGALLEECDPDERAMMLQVVPFPVRVLLRTVFARRYRRYVSAVRGPA